MAALKKTKLQKGGAVGILIFLCWLVYSVSYLGKVNYSANINSVIEFYSISRAEAGLAPTFFFFAYGIGQVVNGILCKKYNIKWMIFLSLASSSIINLIIAVSTNFAIIKWLWMINGFALSMLWPTLIRLLSESLPQKDLGRASVIMGTTVASGTLVIYACSSVYTFFDHFKLAFYTAAFTGLLVALFWIYLYKRVVSNAKDEKTNEETAKKEQETESNIKKKTGNQTFIFGMIFILCVCAVGINLVKDGLTTWLPAILKEEYSVTGSVAILLSVFLPVVAIFGNMFALKTHHKLPDYIVHCGVFFLAILALIGVAIGGLVVKHMLLMLVAVIVASFLASSLNSLLTSVFPMLMRDKLNSGLCAGVLNGCCYLGSTVSSYGIGAIADNFGWKMMFWCLLAFCFLECAICLIYAFVKRITKKHSIVS